MIFRAARCHTQAHTRMASLLREVGCHACAIDVLRRAEEQADAGAQQDLRTRLAEAERAASGRAPADHYKLLGVPRTCTPDDVRVAACMTLHGTAAQYTYSYVPGQCYYYSNNNNNNACASHASNMQERKAYRRLALTLHPDKAMQGLDVDVGPCCGVGPVPPCAESLEGRVRQEADWLFKRLGEAHAVLSDAATRRKVRFLGVVYHAGCAHAQQLDLELQLHEAKAERASRSFSHRSQYQPATYEYNTFRRSTSAYPHAWGHVPRGACALYLSRTQKTHHH